MHIQIPLQWGVALSEWVGICRNKSRIDPSGVPVVQLNRRSIGALSTTRLPTPNWDYDYSQIIVVSVILPSTDLLLSFQTLNWVIAAF